MGAGVGGDGGRIDGERVSNRTNANFAKLLLVLEFTHFLSAKTHLTPINKGWCAFSQVE